MVRAGELPCPDSVFIKLLPSCNLTNNTHVWLPASRRTTSESGNPIFFIVAAKGALAHTVKHTNSNALVAARQQEVDVRIREAHIRQEAAKGAHVEPHVCERCVQILHQVAPPLGVLVRWREALRLCRNVCSEQEGAKPGLAV